MSNSLFGRLLIASLLLLGVFFSLIYFAINRTYTANTLNAKKDQLQLQGYILLSAASVENDLIAMPDELREPRFDEYRSGLYGFVLDRKGNILWSSYSGNDLTVRPSLHIGSTSPQSSAPIAEQLHHPKPAPGSSEFHAQPDYYVYRYHVEWELISDQPQLLTFVVLEDTAPTREKLKDFQNAILRLLFFSALALVTALLLVLRWGTLPLRNLAKDIKQIENGSNSRLQGQYPLELQGLSRNLNELIDTEQQQRERYHNTLADLAHSLKTPLAVIRLELDNNNHNNSNKNSNALIKEQSMRMEEIITHQLQRAVVAAPNTLSEKIPVAKCVQQIAAALTKVYADKKLTIKHEIDGDAVFSGDKRDLMEILGNITDNACKACVETVCIRVIPAEGKLKIEIHDDGAGISVAQRDLVLKRGQRLDSLSSGQGIGLDVVSDIISSYGGQLKIDQSPLGGALFTIIFTR